MRKSAVVIDVSSTTYCLLPVMNELWNRLEERRSEYGSYKEWERARNKAWRRVLSAQLKEVLSLDWLEEHCQLVEPVIILAYDWKDECNEYWRHEWLRQLTPLLPQRVLKRRVRVFDSPDDKVGRLVSTLPTEPIAYKGGRDYSNNEMNRLKEAVRDILRPVPVGHIQKRGYEADDIMATVAVVNSRLPEELQRDIYLCCNDSDILGLVSDRVTWFDLPRQHRPLVRANIEDINLWRESVKHMPPISSAREIWLEKARDGDTSDKLPATGELMLTLPAIDLLNPPEEHCLWRDERIAGHITSVLTSRGRRHHNSLGRRIMTQMNVINVFR